MIVSERRSARVRPRLLGSHQLGRLLGSHQLGTMQDEGDRPAGGSGTRLHPVTRALCKQLLPVYDKPMIYYPISTLMLAGIRDILVISTPHDIPGDAARAGRRFGLGGVVLLRRADGARGLADAFIVGEDFIGNDRSALILGDNIFFGHGLSQVLARAASHEVGARVFAYRVSDPERYGGGRVRRGGQGGVARGEAAEAPLGLRGDRGSISTTRRSCRSPSRSSPRPGARSRSPTST